MPIEAARHLEPGAATVKIQVSIDAPADRVWETLTTQPDSWWLDSFRCVSSGPSHLSLDLRAGGALAETSDSGGAILWFTVIAIDPGRSLTLSGHLAPPWGGPASTFLIIELSEEDGATTVEFTNCLYGHLNEGLLDQIGPGWELLIEKGLKACVETGARLDS